MGNPYVSKLEIGDVAGAFYRHLLEDLGDRIEAAGASELQGVDAWAEVLDRFPNDDPLDSRGSVVHYEAALEDVIEATLALHEQTMEEWT